MEGNLIGSKLSPSESPEVRLLVLLLRLLVRLCATIGCWQGWEQAKAVQVSMGTPSWDSADREPVVGSMSVHSDMSHYSLAFFGMHHGDLLKILAFEIRLAGLDQEPPFRLVLLAHVSHFDSHAHICFFRSLKFYPLLNNK